MFLNAAYTCTAYLCITIIPACNRFVTPGCQASGSEENLELEVH